MHNTRKNKKIFAGIGTRTVDLWKKPQWSFQSYF